MRVKLLFICLFVFSLISVFSQNLLFARASIDLESPDGGETICAGSDLEISWTVVNVLNVRIELSDDGGNTFPYLLVASTDAAAGKWLWTIPDNQAEGNQYRIRIINIIAPDIADTSENNFTIYARTGFTQTPEPLTICSGETAVFRVSALGHDLTYQWLKNSSPISGANQPALYINDASEDDEGYYSCKVTGFCGIALSDSAFLNIKDSPKITADPVGDTLCAGKSITLRAEASGVGLNFSWNKNGQHIPGSNTSELILNNLTKADSGDYVCIVSGACHPKDTSKPAYVVVYNYPRIILAPQSQTVSEGTNVTFTVKASGDGLHYQWQKNGTDIADSTNTTLTLHSVTKADSGSYTCVITNKCSKMITKAAILNVIATEKPVIELTVSSVDFGNVGLSNNKDTLLANVIRNSSQLPLIINSIKIIGPDAGDFNVFGINFPITIPAGHSRNMNIEFVPASLGVKTATVTFNTNAENVVSISLIGYGIESHDDLIANDWDFGDVLIGSENQISHNVIKNISRENIAITIQLPVVMSYDSLNFRLLDDEDYPKTINPGDSAETNFMFVPTVAKTYEVQVVVKNSGTKDLLFKLKGKGLLTDVSEYSEDSNIRIYPNPATDYCEFNFKGLGTVNTVSVCDIYGKAIIRFNNMKSGFRWDLHTSYNSKCPAGLYFVLISTKDGVYVKKLIIP